MKETNTAAYPANDSDIRDVKSILQTAAHAKLRNREAIEKCLNGVYWVKDILRKMDKAGQDFMTRSQSRNLMKLAVHAERNLLSQL